MRPRHKFSHWTFPRAGIAGLLLLLLAARLLRTLPQPDRPLPDADREYVVQQVIDGDTLLLESGHRVRLIGVDCPERDFDEGSPEPFAEAATAFTRDWVTGKSVKLRFDQERLDRYHRVLAYVELGEVCLNEELLKAGYGRALLQFPYSSTMKTRFRIAEDQAKSEQRGIWSAGRKSSD